MDTNKIVILLVAIVLIAGGLVGYSFMAKQDAPEAIIKDVPDTKEIVTEGETHSVVLKADGFIPAELTVKKGDVVVFTSERGFPFWPASDQHPTHSAYSDFDPLKPVDASTPWSFQFNKVGKWDYHDHLNSTFQGSVTVTE